jgi:anaerobic selenocysteine-containing dehydrogenase
VVDGQTVRVHNDRASLVLPAKVTNRLRPGVVAVPWGWWADAHGNGGGANDLTNGTLTDWGGGVAYSDTLVAVEPV